MFHYSEVHSFNLSQQSILFNFLIRPFKLKATSSYIPYVKNIVYVYTKCMSYLLYFMLTFLSHLIFHEEKARIRSNISHPKPMHYPPPPQTYFLNQAFGHLPLIRRGIDSYIHYFKKISLVYTYLITYSQWSPWVGGVVLLM